MQVWFQTSLKWIWKIYGAKIICEQIHTYMLEYVYVFIDEKEWFSLQKI